MDEILQHDLLLARMLWFGMKKRKLKFKITKGSNNQGYLDYANDFTFFFIKLYPFELVFNLLTDLRLLNAQGIICKNF